MLDLNNVTLRWGRDARFLNIDYDGSEIGYLKFDANGEIERVEAFPWSPTVRSSSWWPGAPVR